MDYTLRNCPEEEWEELYRGKLGILGWSGHVGQDNQSKGMVETRKGSDHMWQKDAQHIFRMCTWSGVGISERRERPGGTRHLQRKGSWRA